MIHKVLSVKQPLAYLICSGIKDIENRTWKLPEKYKGERVLIHASGTKMKGLEGDYLNDAQIGYLHCGHTPLKELHKYYALRNQYSAIIGSVRFVDCVINHPSIWAEYTRGWPSDPKVIYHWVLANPILFDKPILNVKGKLGFWDYDLEEECDKHKQKQALIDMMIGDEEIGLYDDNQKQQ